MSKKIGDVNYITETPERRKKKRHVHVNLLKKFLARKQNDIGDTENVTLVSSKEVVNECEVEPSPFVGSKLSNSDALHNINRKLEHLSPAQAEGIKRLLKEHQDLFGDVPRLCPLLPHDVEVQETAPIRQAPYHLSTQKRDFLRKEVTRLQQQGLIRPSISPWASPVVLVPKAGGE